MTIECVKLGTSHLFPGNPISEQHRLRHKTIIQRQGWEVPEFDGMEYDEYDNPATTYLIWRDEHLTARGVSRLYPTDRPFMLQEKFTALVTRENIPQGLTVLEGSRFCIDHTLPIDIRNQIAKELILSYLEYGLSHNISHIVGLMYPAYWRNLFIKNGWDPIWLGECHLTSDGKKSRAGYVKVTPKYLERVRDKLGMQNPVLTYGVNLSNQVAIAA